MKVLITGVTGMIGTHFALSCLERGWTAIGIARNSASSRLAAARDPSVIGCDVLACRELEEVFKRVRPDLVVHLAAQAFNGSSWQTEEITHVTNYLGTANVMYCCRTIVPKARVLLACSSAEYGNVRPEDCPLKEERFLQPFSPYGVSKVAVECLGYQHYANYCMAVYLPRLFIHVGTGHPPATAIQNFARQLALIAKGKAEPVLRVGALTTARDFIDVRDGVNAMMLLLESGNPGRPVNVCTGKAHRISEVLEILIELSGLKVQVESDPTLMRPSDEPLLVGDNSRLRALGWVQKYTMRETLAAVYEDWISRV